MTLLTITIIKACNRPFLSSPRPLYQNKVKCSAFDMEMIFHSHANKIHFHKKGCTLGLVLKVRVFGTWKWPIVINCQWSFPCRKYRSFINNVKVMKVAKVPPRFLYCLDPSKTLLLLRIIRLPDDIPYLMEQPVRMSTPNVTEVRRVELLQAPFADGLMMVSHVLRSLLRKIASLTTKSRKVQQHAYLAWQTVSLPIQQKGMNNRGENGGWGRENIYIYR